MSEAIPPPMVPPSPVAGVKQKGGEKTSRLFGKYAIKVVATEAKDTDAVDRAGKLLGKENARHDKWMEKHVAVAAPAVPAAVTPAPANPSKGVVQ